MDALIDHRTEATGVHSLNTQPRSEGWDGQSLRKHAVAQHITRRRRTVAATGGRSTTILALMGFSPTPRARKTDYL
jgi:hypothetical protein